MPDVEDPPVQPKTEHSREPSLSSIASSPGAEHDGELLEGGPSSPPASVQVQKRKGGRKPIYATSEERKQRNRQAQAAFRERRTEYIKQLETTIKQQDDTLQNLQQSHRSAADECLMLRYKNSLLERILLEKGVDVQTELKKKEIPIPGKLPPALSQAPVQRPTLGRHHLNRPGSGPQTLLQKGQQSGLANHSPQLQPTPPSHTSSPTTVRSPTYTIPGNMNPPPPGYKPQLQMQTTPRAGPGGNTSSPISGPGLQAIAPQPNQQPGSAGHRPSHWPSPYQTHISQLEQEYDAPSDMMEDDTEEQVPSGPGPYPQPYPPQSYQPTSQDPQQQQQYSQAQAQVAQQAQAGGYHQVGGQYIDPFDPMLDADPFGLTASMHFPTQFSFQESSMRK